MPDTSPPRRAPWTRRRTLASALALAAAIAVLPRPDPAVPPAARTELDLWRNWRAARAIGRRYLAERPAEADRAQLARQLFGAGAPPHAPADIRRTIDAARRRDFGRGDTVLVDGWLLARSEARLCALSALS